MTQEKLNRSNVAGRQKNHLQTSYQLNQYLSSMDRQQIIECVPNFSEGRDMNIIKQITDEIDGVEGVRLLNVDPGKVA